MIIDDSKGIFGSNDGLDNFTEFYAQPKIPKKLYKYFSLPTSDDDRNERLRQLINGQLWLSTKELLNDPLDMMMLSTDSLSANEKNYYYESLKNKCCLSLTSGATNTLMWAHYAQAFSGYCVGFTHANNANVKPINYNKGLLNLIEEYKAFYSLLNSPEGEKLFSSIALLMHDPNVALKIKKLTDKLLYTKTKEWKYEKEYRIVLPLNDNSMGCKGMLYNVTELGLSISEITMGLRTLEENKRLLMQCCDAINRKRKKFDLVKLYQLEVKGCKLVKYRVNHKKSMSGDVL